MMNITSTPPASDGAIDPGLTIPPSWADWYLTDEEDMGEGGEQYVIIRALLSYLTELARERQWQQTFIGADQFFAWMEDEPLVRVSPDVYLLDFIPERPLPASWQTWLTGHRPPRLALEIVSEGNWRKDYRDAPAKYAQLGAGELVVFDPGAVPGRPRLPQRTALQVFRWSAGAFTRVEQGAGPVYSGELDAWLAVQRDADAALLRIARDAAGLDLVASVEEAREEERAAREQAQAARERERAAREQAQAAREQAQAAREQAEKRLAEVEAELDQLKRQSRS